MEIRIIKNAPGVTYEPVAEGRVLQITEGKHSLGDLHSEKYEIFCLDSNEKEEIEPDLPKYRLWDIVSLNRQNRYIYFTSCSKKDKGRVEITLYRYEWETKASEQLFGITDELILYPDQKKTRIFLLDENHLLCQNMYLRANGMENYHGFLDFELSLYSVKEKKNFPVTDQYLLQAGISFMAPISKNVCAIKTGYNLLRGDGFRYLSDAETVTENIGFVNVKQMISDILLKQKNIYIDIIDQVKTDKTIPAFQVQEDYLIYSRVSREGREEVFFYHYSDKEVNACIFPNVHRMEDLSSPCIFDGIPCILMAYRKGTQLYNLKKEKKEFVFGNDTQVKEICKDFLVIETRHKRKLWKPAYTTVQVYRYQGRDLLVNEKGRFHAVIVPQPDSLYLFLQ